MVGAPLGAHRVIATNLPLHPTPIVCLQMAIRGRSGKLGTHRASLWPRPVYLQVSRRFWTSDQNFRKRTASSRCSPATHSGHHCGVHMPVGMQCAGVCVCVYEIQRHSGPVSTQCFVASFKEHDCGEGPESLTRGIFIPTEGARGSDSPSSHLQAP